MGRVRPADHVVHCQIGVEARTKLWCVVEPDFDQCDQIQFAEMHLKADYQGFVLLTNELPVLRCIGDSGAHGPAF